MRRHLRPLIVVCLFFGACGGGDGRPPDGPETPPPSGASDNPPPGLTVVRGGERLGWDQPGPSAAAVQSYTFVLYVDGARNALADVRCTATGGAAGFTCSGILPRLPNGSHVLEVSAVDRGIEGPTSAPLNVMVAASETGALASLVPSAAGIVCIDSGLSDCFDAQPLAVGVGDVTDIVDTGTGVAFYIESGRSVEMLRADGARFAAALTADDGVELVSLAVPPNFAQTRYVFVGSVQEARDSSAEFTVTRFREVAGILGEGARIFSLPAGAASRVPIAVDADGHVYVALPAVADDVRHLSAFAYNGHVLRFDADGRLPDSQSSPVLAPGFPVPSTLVHDAAGRRIWLAGSGIENRHAAVVMLPGQSGAAQFNVLADAGASTSVDGSRPPSLAVGTAGDALDVWVADGGLHRAVVSGGSVSPWQRVPVGFGRVAAVAHYAGALTLVIQDERATTADRFDIVRLVPRGGTPEK